MYKPTNSCFNPDFIEHILLMISYFDVYFLLISILLMNIIILK